MTLKTTKNYLTLNIPPLSCPSATTSLGVTYVVVAAVVRTHLDFFLLTNRQHKATALHWCNMQRISVGKYEQLVNKERGLAGNSCISLQTPSTLQFLTLY